MKNSYASNFGRWASIAYLCMVLSTSSGCVTQLANLVHAIKGNNLPAEFRGLEGKRTAVVCSTEAGVHADASTVILSRYVRELLDTNVKNAKLVSQQEIDGWIKSQGNDQPDYVQIGKGVEADYVVAIDMIGLKLREGSTLYRGHSDVSVAVYDIHKGTSPIFRRSLHDFTYPQNTGQPSMDTDESKFRRLYLNELAIRIGTYFYPHEFGKDVANDAKISGY